MYKCRHSRTIFMASNLPFCGLWGSVCIIYIWPKWQLQLLCSHSGQEEEEKCPIRISQNFFTLFLFTSYWLVFRHRVIHNYHATKYQEIWSCFFQMTMCFIKTKGRMDVVVQLAVFALGLHTYIISRKTFSSQITHSLGSHSLSMLAWGKRFQPHYLCPR